MHGVRVEQALHGYSDGHRLLAASRDLSRDAKHVMLTLSDMSGRTMAGGFEEYLTGYPVPGSTYYAFAKTWYAAEMERPGCVWTHTLLIDASDIASIQDLGLLQAWFRRPKSRGMFGDYQSVLELAITAESAPSLPSQYRDATVAIVAALYGSPNAPTFMRSRDAQSPAPVVLAVWNQQWSRLRKAFAFCTGSIGNRSLGGRPFDLQIIPETSEREVRREVSDAIVTESGSRPERDLPAGWLSAAVEDLSSPSPSHLRGFLEKFGDALGGGREVFEPLVELSFCLPAVAEHGGTFHELIEAVGERFPSPRQAGSLKRLLLGAGAPLTRLLYPDRGEPDLLEALATTQHASAYDSEALEAPSRSVDLWRDDKQRTGKLIDALLCREHNHFGEEILASLVANVAAADLPALFADRPGVLTAIARRDPEIITAPGLWSGPSDRQRELFDAATAGQEVGEATRSSAIVAMLDAGSDAVADQVFNRFGDRAAAVVLDWLNHQDAEGRTGRLRAGWRRALTRHRASVLRWLTQPAFSIRSDVIALLAELLDPHTKELQRLGQDLWLQAVRDAASMGAERRTRLFAFALAFALDPVASLCNQLAANTFEPVHAVAAAGRLDYETWLLFEGTVPSLSAWRNWDRCERLRRGLIDQFERQQWPVAQFLQCAGRTETLHRLLHSASEYKAGKQLLMRLRREKDGLVPLLSEDRAGIFHYYV